MNVLTQREDIGPSWTRALGMTRDELRREPIWHHSSAGKKSTCNEGDLGLIPGWGRSSGEGKGCPLQYSGLENSMDCIVHGVAKNQTQLSDFHFHLSILKKGLSWNRLTDLENKFMVTRRETGERIVREFGIYMYTLLHYKWITSTCIPHGTLLNVMWQSGDQGVWGSMDTCICMSESLCCPPETITTLLISYTSTQNKKF